MAVAITAVAFYIGWRWWHYDPIAEAAAARQVLDRYQVTAVQSLRASGEALSRLGNGVDTDGENWSNVSEYVVDRQDAVRNALEDYWGAARDAVSAYRAAAGIYDRMAMKRPTHVRIAATYRALSRHSAAEANWLEQHIEQTQGQWANVCEHVTALREAGEVIDQVESFLVTYHHADQALQNDASQDLPNVDVFATTAAQFSDMAHEIEDGPLIVNSQVPRKTAASSANKEKHDGE